MPFALLGAQHQRETDALNAGIEILYLQVFDVLMPLLARHLTI